MEIEILTTKRKLSKSIVNQMRMPSKTIMETGEVLGYLIKVVKGCFRGILIRKDFDWYIIKADYVKGEMAVYRKSGKWTTKIQFKTTIECDEWWQEYEKVKADATKQIYL